MLRPVRLRQTHSYIVFSVTCVIARIVVSAAMSRTESTQRCAWKAASPTLAIIALTTRSAIARYEVELLLGCRFSECREWCKASIFLPPSPVGRIQGDTTLLLYLVVHPERVLTCSWWQSRQVEFRTHFLFRNGPQVQLVPLDVQVVVYLPSIDKPEEPFTSCSYSIFGRLRVIEDLRRRTQLLVALAVSEMAHVYLCDKLQK